MEKMLYSKKTYPNSSIYTSCIILKNAIKVANLGIYNTNRTTAIIYTNKENMNSR